MKTKPLVSIITPSYKSKDTIEQTYNSILSQTFSDWEWIVVDDCSDDGSFEYVQEITKNENRVKLLKADKNGGTAIARNIGLKNALGKYITFLDSDDLLDSNYLEEQLKFIKDNGPIVSSGYRRKAKKTCTDFFVPDVVDYKKILKGNPLSCLSTMYDREVVGERYFPDDLKKCEDYVFWLNILKDGFVAKGNKQSLATYNIRQGSKSSNKVKLIKYMYRIYHDTQKINWFLSWMYVIRWAFYGLKKYRGVK